MIRITFTPEHLEQLRYERFHHPHPRVQQKMEALLLKSQGLAHEEICRIVGITGNTLRAYLREFMAGGVEGFKQLRFTGARGELAAHRTTLEAYFREHPPATIKEAVVKIEELTGIQRGETRVRQFLTSIGMRGLKVGFVPAKADVEELRGLRDVQGSDRRLYCRRAEQIQGRARLSADATVPDVQESSVTGRVEYMQSRR